MTPAEVAVAARLHRPTAVRWAASYVGAEAAEDVAHAALEALVKNAADVRVEAAAAWLRTAVWRHARDVRPRRLELLVEPPEQVAPAPGPEDTLVSQQLSEKVRRALERVPASRRRVLVAVEGEGRPLAVVAREEGIPESTARVRLRDGAEDLRAELVRQRVAERRRTGGFASWAFTWALVDARAWFRRGIAALGGLAAGGALLIPLVVRVSDEPLAPTAEDTLAAPFEPAPLSWPVNEAWAVREESVSREGTPDGAGLTDSSRRRHDVHARMLSERLRRAGPPTWF